MNLQEIDAEIERLTQIRVEALREAEAKQKQEELIEARGLVETLITTINRLYQIGYLPPRLVEALSDREHKVNPGLYIKRPRDPGA